MNHLSFASCALILLPGAKCVAVSRKSRLGDFGLPGGKLDHGENFLDACVRETQEETGLVIYKALPLFGEQCGDFWVLTYLCKAQGVVATRESGIVQPLMLGNLIMDSQGNETSFSKYNIGVVAKLTRFGVLEPDWLNKKIIFP